ncbi:hypothetical protein J3Q64DRAFT_1826258 [Phycomyces blakesleeanus]|uniref:Uncharacterized protein n=1 Tax=Phycomyces blakesleeanus TaxID=4837 RepID=A0ABR3AJE7_PHYBL
MSTVIFWWSKAPQLKPPLTCTADTLDFAFTLLHFLLVFPQTLLCLSAATEFPVRAFQVPELSRDSNPLFPVGLFRIPLTPRTTGQLLVKECHHQIFTASICSSRQCTYFAAQAG